MLARGRLQNRIDTQQSVHADIQHHRRQNRADDRRRNGVGMRQPGMKRHDAAFRGEADKDEQRRQRDRCRREFGAVLRQCRPVQRAFAQGVSADRKQQNQADKRKQHGG